MSDFYDTSGVPKMDEKQLFACTIGSIDQVLLLTADAPSILESLPANVHRQLFDRLAALLQSNFGHTAVEPAHIRTLGALLGAGLIPDAAVVGLLDQLGAALLSIVSASTQGATSCLLAAKDAVRLCRAVLSRGRLLPQSGDASASRLADGAVALLTHDDSAVVTYAIRLLKLVHSVHPSTVIARMPTVMESIFTVAKESGPSENNYNNNAASSSERPAAANPASVPDSVYDILCAFADLLLAELPSSFVPSLAAQRLCQRRVSDCRLWRVLQRGLCHGSSLARKQSLFVLRVLLDQYASGTLDDPSVCGCCAGDVNPLCPASSWTSGTVPVTAAEREQTVAVWQNYLLLLETFAEKQYHVIEPALVRLQLVIAAVEQGRIHASWIATLFTRVSMHENATLRRWGLCQLLSLDVGRCRFFPHGQEKFLVEDVMQLVTSDINSFLRQHGEPLGVEPQVSLCFRQYLTSCDRALTNLDQKKSFFQKLIRVLSRGAGSGWCPIPGMYICKALQYLPCGGFCWNRSAVQDLCHLLSVTIRQADTRVRLATQHFLLTAAVHLTDKAQLEIVDVIQLIKALSADKILQNPVGLPRRCFTQWLHELFKTWSNEKCTAAIELAASGNHGELMLMLAEGDLLPSTGALSFQSWVANLVDTINCSSSRAYLTSSRVFEAATCIGALLHWTAGTGLFRDVVCKAAQVCDLAAVLLRPADDLQADVIHGPMFHDSWGLMLLRPLFECLGCRADKQLCDLTSAIAKYFSQISDSAIRKNLQCWCLLAAISDVCCARTSSFSSTGLPLTQTEVLRLLTSLGLQDHLLLPDPGDIGNAEERGRIMNKHVKARWSSRKLLIQVNSDSVDALRWIEQARDSIEIVSDETNTAIFEALKPVLVLATSSSSQIVPLVTACFAKVQEESRATSYPQQLAALLRAVLQPSLMASEQLQDMHTELISQVLSIGCERMGLANVATSILLCVFNSDLTLAFKYLSLLVDLAMYGPAYSKSAKTDLDVYAQLEQTMECRELCRLSGESSVGRSKAADEVRVAVLRFIAARRVDCVRGAELATEFVTLCMSRFIETLNYKSVRSFPHSLVHRQRHRLLCILLALLYSCIDKEATRLQLISSSMRALSGELQPSNRLQLEWLLTVLLLANDKAQQLIFVQDLCDVAKLVTKKPVFVCSMLSVMAHLCTAHDDISINDARAILEAFITAIQPWIMYSKYHVRACAHAALRKVWQQHIIGKSRAGAPSKTGDAAVDGSLQQNWIILNPVLQGITNTLLCSGAIVEKSTQKLFEYFFWKLRPSQDLTLEAVFSIIPQLSGVTDDEIIDPTAFLPWDEKWAPQLWCTNQELKACQPMTWQPSSSEAAFGSDGDADVSTHDLQKKIVTWRTQEPEEEFSEGKTSSGERQSSDGMVLVASLLDRVPNIAGLCRTGEIFGVKEYAMSNLLIMEDNEFQAISVSAQRWIRTKQVAPHMLKLYLASMRANGYTLVGMEQTVNSVCLTDYVFQDKTLLILGNEKSGIPADVIQELDVCLEIPQQGIIRSLNVHVCGAIAIWEYRRQMLHRTRCV